MSVRDGDRGPSRSSRRRRTRRSPTNFFTFIDSTNARPTLPRRGHNKQKRHDLRQLGLALVVSRDAQLPLFHLLYAGDRPDVRTFPEVLTSVRTRLERLFGTAPP